MGQKDTLPRVFRLTGTCNNYPWGKKGKESLAARLHKKSPGTGFEIKESEPYSEMWFGDYPDYPARVLETQVPLAELISRHPLELLGQKLSEKDCAQLPYLPKILSIAKALPLQIHPNKELSEELHRQQPDKFTDPNHKPEIAIALSKFEVFAGWKPLSSIAALFRIKGLGQMVPPGTAAWTDETLREVVRNFLQADDSTIRAVASQLNDLSGDALDALGDQRYVVELLPRLQDQYGSADPGSLVALLLMNYLVLAPGEALFIPADGIHAYLSGDIVECMARSNNVLNTGFCPRADRDNVDLFVNTLTFRPHSKDEITLPGVPGDIGLQGHTVVYDPPIQEFSVARVQLNSGEEEEIQAIGGPSIAIVTKGGGRLRDGDAKFSIVEGSILFIAPGTRVAWEAGAGLEVFIIMG